MQTLDADNVVDEVDHNDQDPEGLRPVFNRLLFARCHALLLPAAYQSLAKPCPKS
jgi:hypothetical protein